ncbi:MAG TPA: exodeoxyribonuclease VII small subunit [Acidimicrobiales bacterium]|nr:exodeoxyribonuclease VII small subunit [Acidimicrobiales bacterium]
MSKADDLGTLTFEQLLERLEELTGRMASGDVGIEEAADLYEEAGTVYAAARDRLAAVQERIERLRAAGGPAPAAG